MDARPHRDTDPDQLQPKRRRHRRRWLLLLLIVPFVGALWVPSYNSLTPTLWGIPFFYWYQLLWVILGAGITILAYVGDPS
ncbi:MAG TPA: DUF3311 domain-containing protein [Gemmatimonadaceae bacterium]|nr:DUF3311 domain-containing protein [Gemmatimonadaceae bacterium]